MASMVAWTSIESIGWIPWSPIVPWIPQKLSVESMETYGKHRKLMPLNFPLNFHCCLEVHGNGVRILHRSLREGPLSANAFIIRYILNDGV